MFDTEKQLLKRIADHLARIPGVRMAVAYGSRVRGDFRDDSDFDVMVVVDRKDRSVKDAIVGIFYEVELASEISFAVTLYSRKEFDVNSQMGSPFLRNVLTEGIVFYDTERRRQEESVAVSS